MRDNKISVVPDAISSLSRLERLDLGNNNINALPASMGLLTSLNALVLEGNPLRGMRRDLVGRGAVALLKHLRYIASL